VHAQKALANALLQFGQRLVEQPVAAGAAQRDELLLGLQLQHLGGRHAQHAAAVAHHQHRAGRGRRLGEAVGNVQLKGAQRVLALRADERQRWRGGLAADRISQRQPAAAVHHDVERHQVAGMLLQPAWCLGGVGRLAGQRRASPCGGGGGAASSRAIGSVRSKAKLLPNPSALSGRGSPPILWTGRWLIATASLVPPHRRVVEASAWVIAL
jgi:hypothetical protein